jgi:hypothetical protein
MIETYSKGELIGVHTVDFVIGHIHFNEVVTSSKKHSYRKGLKS